MGRGVNTALFKASEEINMCLQGIAVRRVSFPLRKQEHYNTSQMESLCSSATEMTKPILETQLTFASEATFRSPENIFFKS